MRRTTAGLVLAVAALTGCGAQDAEPAAVRALQQDLRAVDRAVVDGDWAQAGRALGTLRDTTATAHRREELPDDQRATILAAADGLEQRIHAEQQAAAARAAELAAQRTAAQEREAAARAAAEAQRQAAAEAQRQAAAEAQRQAAAEAQRQAAAEAPQQAPAEAQPAPRADAGAPPGQDAPQRRPAPAAPAPKQDRGEDEQDVPEVEDDSGKGKSSGKGSDDD